MKRLFIWLLKRYSNTEKERIEILKVLNDKVQNDYNEQSVYGNVYNYLTEFIMSNDFIVKCVKEKDEKSLRMLKIGFSNTFDNSIEYIENEQ